MIEVRNIRSSYKYYKSAVEQPVDIKLYIQIVLGFISYMVRKVFEGNDVKLSTGDSLGTIAIRGDKVKPKIDENGNVKGVAISWGRTNKLWSENPEAKAKKQLVYCLNEHSNGIKYKFVWIKQDMRLHNKTYYSLSLSRKNRRTLSKLINEGKEYLVNT